jgi:hypothetical protein
MNQEGKSRLMCVAAGGLCGLGLMSSAIASPPISRGRTSPSTIDSARSIMAAGSRSLAHQEHTSSNHLDLRPLEESSPTMMRGGAAAFALTPFPTAIRHLNLGKADLGTDSRIPRPALGTGELNFRTMSQAEMFARRVHREGLPVARLWESNSALLSIGLNQKGKPGLWLTQKVH